MARDAVAGTFIVTGYAEAHQHTCQSPDLSTTARAPRRRRCWSDAKPHSFRAVRGRGGVDPHARRSGPCTDPPPASARLLRAGEDVPRRVEQVIDAALDAIDPARPFDLMTAFCVRPGNTIASILGVDGDRLTDFRDWSEGVILEALIRSARRSRPRRWTAVEGRAAQLFPRADRGRRRAAPRRSHQRYGGAAGGGRGDQRRRARHQPHRAAGRRQPDDYRPDRQRRAAVDAQSERTRQAACRSSSLAPALVEVLRYEGPVDITQRIMAEIRRSAAAPFGRPKRCRQFCAANRDPAIYEDAETFVIDAKRAPHLSFGGGSHICIGAPLARLEGQIALLKLFQRFRPAHCVAGRRAKMANAAILPRP
ncbi:cytochrome P450 [Sphingomonas sp. MMS24-JH45]